MNKADFWFKWLKSRVFTPGPRGAQSFHFVDFAAVLTRHRDFSLSDEFQHQWTCHEHGERLIYKLDSTKINSKTQNRSFAVVSKRCIQPLYPQRMIIPLIRASRSSAGISLTSLVRPSGLRDLDRRRSLRRSSRRFSRRSCDWKFCVRKVSKIIWCSIV